MTRTLVIIPAFNEEATVGTVVQEVIAGGFDVLVVDDGSMDKTAHAAQMAGSAVVSLPVNLGVGGALRTGFKFAVAHGYDNVVQCDADGQHPPVAIQGLVDAAKERDSHLLVGSRFADGGATMPVGPARRLVMRYLARAASKATGAPITDATSGFRVISEPLLSEFALTFPVDYLGDTYEALIAAGRGGYRVAEVPAPIVQREVGVSSATPGAAIRFIARAVIVAITRTQFPIRPHRS